MCEQATIYSLNGISSPEALYSAIRPGIDVLLDMFNMSARHVVAADIQKGISLRYAIKSSGLSANTTEDNKAGTRVILRIEQRKNCVAIEVPANRVTYYEKCGTPVVSQRAPKNEDGTPGAPLWYRISLDQNLDVEVVSQAIHADIYDFLMTYPSDYGCCSLYEQCSNAKRCLQKDQDMSASCYYKRNLLTGRVFYGEDLTGMQLPPEEFTSKPVFTIPEQYVVLDTETTGFGTYDKIVEIAAIKYKSGKSIDKFVALVNPQRPIPSGASKMHGIKKEDVADAPVWESLEQDFFQFIGDLPLVGHNLSFDIRMLEQQSKIKIENYKIDTFKISKEIFPGLDSYTLEYLNAALHLTTVAAHRAFADVETTNQLLWACTTPELYTEITRQASTMKQEQKNKKSNAFKKHYSNAKKADEFVPEGEVDQSNVLYGKRVVFTGEISVGRDRARQLAVNAGALVPCSVSCKIDYLVVGAQDIELVGADGKSTKEKKAHELNESGKAHIKIIGEKEFFALLEQKIYAGANS